MPEKKKGSDVEFEFGELPLSNTAWASIASTLTVLSNGMRTRVGQSKSMGHIIRWRRQRLVSLKDAGLTVLAADKKLAFARNCPPCAVILREPPQRCGLRLCPFCHARRVEAAFMALDQTRHLLAGANKPHKVIQLTTKVDDIWRDEFKMVAGRLTARFQDVVLNKRHRPYIDEQRQLFLRDAYLGFSWLTLEPYVYDTGQATTSTGYWKVRHGVIALVPESWNKDPSPAIVRELYPLKSRPLATLTAGALKYPRRWMSGEVNAVAQMFNDSHRVRFFRRFGSMKMAHKWRE